MEAALQEVRTPQPAPQPKGLVARLIQAMGEIQLIPKRGQNQFSNYSYATAEDIIQAVRGPLAKHGLLVYSTLKERLSEEIKTAQGKGAWRERIVLQFVVTDGENSLSFDVPGEGQDTGDKAIYKALTGSTKYALRSLLQLPIGDDPEADSHDTARTAARGVQKPVPFSPPPLKKDPPPPPAALPQPPSNPNGATERQVKAIRSLARAASIDDTYLATFLKQQYQAESVEALSKAQASELLSWLKAAVPSSSSVQ